MHYRIVDGDHMQLRLFQSYFQLSAAVKFFPKGEKFFDLWYYMQPVEFAQQLLYIFQ